MQGILTKETEFQEKTPGLFSQLDKNKNWLHFWILKPANKGPSLFGGATSSSSQATPV